MVNIKFSKNITNFLSFILIELINHYVSASSDSLKSYFPTEVVLLYYILQAQRGKNFMSIF